MANNLTKEGTLRICKALVEHSTKMYHNITGDYYTCADCLKGSYRDNEIEHAAGCPVGAATAYIEECKNGE